MEYSPSSMMSHFSMLEDPRANNSEHILLEVITIALCAVICGADSWVEIATFGRAKESWFATFLQLPSGIPSHDTFGRIFAKLDPEQFQARFLSWMQGVQEVTQGQVVAIDGKTVRHSYDKLSGRKAIHMVSAWASENRLVLGQVKVDEKSNEITAIPELLQTLALSGCIVTIDAMGCQKEIAHQVIEQEADYVLVVKGNQPHLQEDVTELFAYAAETDFENTDYAKTINKGHGRIEIRECWTLTDPDYLGYIRHLDEWVGCRSIAMIKSERRIGTESSTEVRYFISSLNGSAKQTLGAVRQHWGVENGLHWKLDIAFREDECRVRQENAAENFVVLRHVALNLLNQEKTAKVGTHAKRLKAGWDERYLLKILNN